MDKLGKRARPDCLCNAADYDFNMALATAARHPIDPTRRARRQRALSRQGPNLSTGRRFCVRAHFYFGVWALIGLALVYLAASRAAGASASTCCMIANAAICACCRTDRSAMATPVKLLNMIPEAVALIADDVLAVFKRPVDERKDFSVDLQPAGQGLFVAEYAVPAGQWIVDISTKRDGAKVFHQTLRTVAGGGVQ
jgi:hypothetical protein